MAVVGVDIGTQSLKAVVTSEGGVLLAEASESYDVLQPRAGWAEQDPRLWERALSKVVPKALATAGLQASQVQGLAIAGQLDGCLAVDTKGQPLSNCLIWMDRRSVDYVPDASAERLAATGLVFDASHMAAKIRWLKAHGKLASAARFHQPTSYLVERLCGAYVFDHGLASTTMLYDLRARDYGDELLARFDLNCTELPAIADAESRAGVLSAEGAKLCGLPMGTPLAVGTGDDFSTILGAGLSAPGPMLCGLGTAEVVGTMSMALCIDTLGLVETHEFLQGYYVQNPGWQSGGALRWIRTILNIDSDETLDLLAAEAPPGSDGVTFLPALSGAMAPRWNASARACFYGLSSHHGKAHMARAVYEGCAFAMRDVRERLQGMGLAGAEIILQGGGAKSALWGQIRADLCSARVERQLGGIGSEMGAALIAEVLVDPSVSLAELAAARRPHALTQEPNAKNAQAYEDAYGRYRLLFDSLEPMF
tara:strand:- start:94337 stop:95779 length:1443 start_codon:yes stop_codon:yes gene_type:complete